MGKTAKGKSNTGKIKSIEQAAKFLGVHERSLSRWRHRGAGPKFVRYGPLGNAIGYREEDLKEFQAATMQGELFDPKTATQEQRRITRKPRRAKQQQAPATEVQSV